MTLLSPQLHVAIKCTASNHQKFLRVTIFTSGYTASLYTIKCCLIYSHKKSTTFLKPTYSKHTFNSTTYRSVNTEIHSHRTINVANADKSSFTLPVKQISLHLFSRNQQAHNERLWNSSVSNAFQIERKT